MVTSTSKLTYYWLQKLKSVLDSLKSKNRYAYYLCKFHIAVWDFTSCKTLLATFEIPPTDFSYSDLYLRGWGDSLYLFFTFVTTTRSGNTTSFRIMQINGDFLGVTATFTKTTSGTDNARGIFVSSSHVYLGLSTNSKEFRVSSSQTSYLIKYDLSLSGNTCITLGSTTENGLEAVASLTRGTYITSAVPGGISFSHSSG